ncbi:MAG: TetR/AcrR family transcriptional regulator [Armatimonadota bacterium]
MLSAEKLFAERGFNGVFVQEIIEMAGVNKAMVYYYFQSKFSLYCELLKVGLECLKDALDLAMQQTTVEQRLRTFLTNYYEVVAARPQLARLVYREVLGYGLQCEPDLPGQLGTDINRLQEIIGEGQRLGELKPLDAMLTACSLFGIRRLHTDEQQFSVDTR